METTSRVASALVQQFQFLEQVALAHQALQLVIVIMPVLHVDMGVMAIDILIILVLIV